MKRFLLIFFTLFTYAFCYSQGGAGPVQSCASPIPEICNGSLYPAATSGTATAPAGTSLNCGFSAITQYGSFYFFESNTNGPLSINITPTDVIGIPYPNINTSPDLDYICWGPFNDLTTMCDLLTNPNQEDCSNAAATTQEVLQITNAVAGEFYVILVANWAASGSTPDPCFIQFTAFGPNDAFGGPSPGDAGADAGWGNPLLFCDTDPQMNLIDQLNGQPVNNGSWTYNGNSVPGTFDPAIDPPGIYTYSIAGSSSGTCPGDDATVSLDVFSAASISITSPSVLCSDENSFTLTGIPPEGWSTQGNGVFTDNLGSVITDFDPASNLPGLHNITYTYTPQGCNPIPVGGTILINEAPTVLPNDVTTNNPSCFGYNDGSALLTASSGQPAYIFNWFGEDPFALTAGTFNYTVTDANQCTFNSSVTLYDPLNTTSIINEYNSSCYGENDGAASITMLGGVTPPGTVSSLAYCASHPNPDFIAQLATSIEEVILVGDNFNINNNTNGIVDHYEDYTATMYADITEGQVYSINITLQDLSGFGAYLGGARVFIDYNIDGDFLDAGEAIGIIPSPSAPGLSVPIAFTVPTTGAFGPTRMRVVAQDQFNITTSNDIDPCDAPISGSNGSPWFGATEDYSIVLNAPSFSATYLWDDGTTTDSIPNLGPGTYYVIITDAETGCPIQDSAVITEPQEITFNPTIIDISCNTFSDGEVVLAPTGGNGGPYNINWNGNNSTALADGSYTVTVTDPSTITLDNTVACFNDTTIVMVEPAYFSADFSVSDLSICSGDPLNLEIDFNSNGIAPFTINYTVNGPSYSEGPVNNLGIYTFTENPLISTTYSISSIVDDNGCINQNTINNIAVNVNPLPNMNISVNPNPICVGDNSALNLNGTTGTPPYNLDYTISDANGTTTATETVGSGGFTSSVSPIITTDYTLTSVTDDSTCVSPLSTVATLVVNEIPQLITTYSNEICEGDMVQIGLDFTAGTPPFNVDYTFNGANTSTSINSTTGELTLIATNPSNITINSITGLYCPKQVDEDIQISVNPLPISNLSGDGSLCDDGSFMYIKFETVSGLALYDIVYTDGNDNFTLTNIGNIDSIPTSTIGTYTLVSVTDQKGCEAISLTGQANVNINPLPDVSIIAYPIITEITDPLINFIDKSTYLNSTPGIWDFGDGSGQISNFGQLDHMYADTGVYHVSLTTVSDSGCTNTAYQTIIINPTFTIYIPNAFTPNNDLDNDYFLPIVDGVKEYELSIYDRQGQRVFRTEEYTNEYCNSGCKAAWDGKINNSSDFGTIGVYVYHIVITDINGKLKSYEGAVTLIR
jgi:hypothetical protein